MLYLHNLYNVDRIVENIFMIPGQTLSATPTKTQERCVPNRNQKYSP